MPSFFIGFLKGKHPESESERTAYFDRYVQWVKDLGDDLVAPETPLMDSQILGGNPLGSSCDLIGYLVLRADDMESAKARAQTCPYCEIGGLFLAQTRKMNRS